MHFTTSRLLVALMIPGALACTDPAEGTAPAVVSDPASPAADPPAEPAADRAGALAIDTARSTFGFVGSKVTASHEGSFGTWSGSVSLDEAGITASSVSIEIQMASVRVPESDRLTGHLQTDDFFDVPNHPTATFESARIVEQASGEGDEATTHLVSGRLTLRGQTRTITFPARIELSDAEVRARARFSINRQEFGIAYAGMQDDLIRDEVVIHFDVRAPRT